MNENRTVFEHTDHFIDDATLAHIAELERKLKEERESCATLVETIELVDPSGLTKTEQLRIYAVLQRVADLIRKKT